MLCGKIVAPGRLLWPCTASTPNRIGMPAPALADAARYSPTSRAPLGPAGAFVAIRAAVATSQDRAERIALQIGRRDRADIALDHLADLLRQRHALEQRGDPRFGGGR
jgi:hypothetical protein